MKLIPDIKVIDILFCIVTPHTTFTVKSKNNKQQKQNNKMLTNKQTNKQSIHYKTQFSNHNCFCVCFTKTLAIQWPMWVGV